MDEYLSKAIYCIKICLFKDQKESKSFLLKPPALWLDDATFQEMRAKIKHLNKSIKQAIIV